MVFTDSEWSQPSDSVTRGSGMNLFACGQMSSRDRWPGKVAGRRPHETGQGGGNGVARLTR